MLFRNVVIAVMFLISLAVAQVSPGQSASRVLYFVEDQQHSRWCGYRDKSESKSDGELFNTMRVAEVEYSARGITTASMSRWNESGDWSVDDKYAFDENQKLQSLSRTYGNYTVGIVQEESYQMRNGKAIKQKTVSRTVVDKKLARELSGDEIHQFPIFAAPQMFPFWKLLGKRAEIWSKGKICVSN